MHYLHYIINIILYKWKWEIMIKIPTEENLEMDLGGEMILGRNG